MPDQHAPHPAELGKEAHRELILAALQRAAERAQQLSRLFDRAGGLPDDEIQQALKGSDPEDSPHLQPGIAGESTSCLSNRIARSGGPWIV